MTTWILLAIAAQFVFAFVAVLDKHIVTSKTVLHPYSYAFYISILSALSILVFIGSSIPVPFGIEIPSFGNLIIPTVQVALLSLTTGFIMFIALVNMYEAFSKADASDVVPVVAAVGAIGTLILEAMFLGGVYDLNNLAGISLLIVGTLLVSQLRFNWDVVLHTVLSGMSFAVYYGLIKYIFNITNFDSGFLYTRLGLVFAALLVIAVPYYRKRIFRKLKDKEVVKKKAGAIVLGIKTLAGLASIMTLKAIQLGSVAIVQAMSGVQFLILIIMAAIFGRFTPETFGENKLSVSDVAHKITAAIVISVGLFYTFL